MNKLIFGALSISLLAGCAQMSTQGGYGTNWEPVVDLRPQQRANYPTDLQECQQLAARTMSASQGAAVGAAGGAVLGAVLGAVGGGNTRSNVHAAGVGAVTGGVGGAVTGEGGQRSIISRCLAGRGYNVLN